MVSNCMHGNERELSLCILSPAASFFRLHQLLGSGLISQRLIRSCSPKEKSNEATAGALVPKNHDALLPSAVKYVVCFITYIAAFAHRG